MLETERLRLRTIEATDAEFIRRLLNQPSFLRFIGDRGVRTTEDAERCIADGPLASYRRHGFGLYLVETRADGAAVGMCGLMRKAWLEHPDLAYAFVPEAEGQGWHCSDSGARGTPGPVMRRRGMNGIEARAARRTLAALVACGLVTTAGCAFTDDPSGSWTGTADTLASGQVVVHNTATPLWPEGSEWRVVEDLRLGSMDSDGPDMFGRIGSFAIDGGGRLWVLDSQSQDVRVFAPDGSHVRTIGRKGGGPGEFAQAVRIEPGPDGNMWVMDPQNNRLSVFDTAGTYVDGKPALGGFIIMPWPGRFDAAGSYYAPTPHAMDEEFRIALVRYDTEFVARDTLETPRDPIERDFFDHSPRPGSRIRAGVPFTGGVTWRLSEQGTIWALVTDEYRLFELSAAGDTLRTITRAFTPVPVTDADREQARENLKWFTDQGGRIDLSKVPRTKPPARGFFHDDEGNIWVELVRGPDEAVSAHDVFGADGRFLGTVQVPFTLSGAAPIVRDGVLYAVTSDELGVQYVVRARIEKPEAAAR